MSTDTDLHLYEELMLLALHDEQGTSNAWYRQAVAGALLAELLAEGRLRVDGDQVGVADPAPLGDALLDEALGKVAGAQKPGSLALWASRLAGLPDLKPRAVEGLVRRGVLREDEDRVLFFFRRQLYREADPAPERALRERLLAAIQSDSNDVAPRTAVLVAIANCTGVLAAALGKEALKTRKERIEAIAKGDAVGQATQEAIAALQAAFMFITMMPAMMHVAR